MTRFHVFSDEAGDFTFQPHGSQFFLIATVTATDCSVGDRLQALQRELAWSGTVLERFHATDDNWAVRDRVFDLLSKANVRIDATADYAAWAVQRWLEMGEKGPYDKIASNVASVFQPWRGGQITYY